MVYFSKLIGASHQIGKSMLPFMNRRTTSLLFNTVAKKQQQTNNQLVLQHLRSSHGRAMPIRPGKFYTKKYFDIIHFYFVLCGAPFLLAIAYANLFVGPATLTEIPEGYEPRTWEYHRNPIKRFLAKYILETPEQAYETTLNELYVEQNKIKMRKLEAKVQNLIKERHDSSAWYYVPESTESIEERERVLKRSRHGMDPRFTK